jgi:ABC-type multidrug transport system fused ATPase/permease subunit
MWSDLASEFLDAAQGVTTLKIFNAAKRKSDQLYQKSMKLYLAQMVQLYLALIVESFTVVTTLGGTALVVAAGAFMVANGALAFPSLVLILLVCREIFKPWIDLSTYWHLGINANSGAKKIAALLDEVPVVKDGEALIRVRPLRDAPAVRLEGVTFTYPSRKEPAVSNVSLDARPGESIAIVGRSGSGKSTLAGLLQRHHDCDRGVIALDGIDIRNMDLHSLRASIAVVAQETYLFSGSIAENIRLGHPDAPDSLVNEAVASAGLADFVKSLPSGLATPVGERGLSLSGGQRQRIAIARAFLKDAPLLILDEATSNVDVENEAGILQALDRLRRGRTTITIAHRLSAIQNADRIYVIDGGKIVESGSHKKLSTRTSTYSKLIRAQEAAA